MTFMFKRMVCKECFCEGLCLSNGIATLRCLECMRDDASGTNDERLEDDRYEDELEATTARSFGDPTARWSKENDYDADD